MPTAIELAEQFQASLVGDGSRPLRGLCPLETAQADQISFLSNPLYRQQAIESKAGALILSQTDLSFLQEQGKGSIFSVSDVISKSSLKAFTSSWYDESAFFSNSRFKCSWCTRLFGN